MPPVLTVPYAPSASYAPNGRLVDLIRAQGQDAARSALQRGQDSANLWNTVGNSIQQGVGAVTQAVQDAPRRKMEALQLQDAQNKANDLKALDNAYSQTGGRDAVINALPGHLKGTVLKQFEDMDKAHSEAQKAQEEADRLTTDAFADTGVQIRSHAYDPSAAQLAISDLKAKYAGNPLRLRQLSQAEQAIHQNPTAETVKAIVDPLISASQKRVELDQKGAQIEQTGKHDTALEANATATQEREAKALAETSRHNVEMEKIQKLTAGREAAQAAEVARHNKEMEKAANPFGVGAGTSGAATGGAQGPTGDDFLKTLSPGTASEIKAYAEGRRPFPTGMSYAKLQPLIQLVGQYDPTFDASNYNARNKARTDLESPSGTGGKTVNALNTALQHAGKLSDLIEKLDNYESPLANAVSNPIRTAMGKTAVTNFNVIAPQAMKEIERLWRGTGGSTSDIKDLIDSIGQNKGRQQQREALANFVDLIEGKLNSTTQQRDNVLGPLAGKSVPILYEQNRPIIETIKQRAGGDAAATTGPKVGETRTYNGETRTWNGTEWLTK